MNAHPLYGMPTKFDSNNSNRSWSQYKIMHMINNAINIVLCIISNKH